MATPPVRSTDLTPYWSQERASDDATPTGGAIDPTMRVLFNDLTPAPTEVLEIVSSFPQDTSQSFVLTVMTTDGLVIQETIQLQGLLPVPFNSLGQINRIESGVLSQTAQGTLTLRQASNLRQITTVPPGEFGFRRMFYQATPSPTQPKFYYEKFFWKNGNSTTAVTQATVALPANPSGRIAHCLAAQINDLGQTPNRITAPSNTILAGPLLFNSTTQDVPGGQIPPGAAIGVWVQLTLVPADAPLRSSFSSQLLGATPD